jgi:hypothetical protein
MRSEDDQQLRRGPPGDGSPADTAQRGISRRAVLGGISAGAAVGTTAWVIPQILTAEPAGGATMSGVPATLGSGTLGPAALGPATLGSADPTTSATTGSTIAGDAPSILSSLARTGLDLERDAEIGATMIAVGWALHRWASRRPEATTRATAGEGPAGSPGRSA